MKLTNVSDPQIERTSAESLGNVSHGTSFDTLFSQVLGQIEDTNQLQMDAETARVEFALGETVNSHDLLIAQQKAATAIQYTVAVKNGIIDAYSQIMQMQI